MRCFSVLGITLFVVNFAQVDSAGRMYGEDGGEVLRVSDLDGNVMFVSAARDSVTRRDDGCEATSGGAG